MVKNAVTDLDLRQMQHRLLIRNHIKVHGLPHSVAQEAADISLPGDDDEVHACGGNRQARVSHCTGPKTNSAQQLQHDVFWCYLPATKRIVPMMPHIGLVTAEGGTSFLPERDKG